MIMRGYFIKKDDTDVFLLLNFQYMQEGNPYYNLYNNEGAAAAAAYSYASASSGTTASSCAKDYKDYKDYSYYGSYFNQVGGHSEKSSSIFDVLPSDIDLIRSEGGANLWARGGIHATFVRF